MGDVVMDMASLLLRADSLTGFLPEAANLLNTSLEGGMAWLALFDERLCVTDAVALGDAAFTVTAPFPVVTEDRRMELALIASTDPWSTPSELTEDQTFDSMRLRAQGNGLSVTETLPLLANSTVVGYLILHLDTSPSDTAGETLLHLARSLALSWSLLDSDPRDLKVVELLKASPLLDSLATASLGVAIIDDDAVIHYHNRHFRTLSGRSRSAVGSALTELLPRQPDRIAVMELIHHGYSKEHGRGVSQLRVRLGSRRRASFWAQLAISDYRLDTFQRPLHICAVRDVSLPVTAEDAIRASTEMLAAAAEMIPVALFSTGSERSSFAFGSLSGAIDRLGLSLEQGTTITSDRNGTFLDEGRWLSVDAKVSQPDGEGLVGTIIDVTDVKETEAKILKSAELQRTLALLSGEAITASQSSDIYPSIERILKTWGRTHHLLRIEVGRRSKLLVSAYGDLPIQREIFPQRSALLARARRYARPAIETDITSDSMYSELVSHGLNVKHALFLPVSGREKVVEMMVIGDREPMRFSEEELGFLKAVANILTAISKRDETEREASRLAHVDRTTGLETQPGFLVRLRELLTEPLLDRLRVVSIALADFPSIIDMFGHDVADYILHTVASRTADEVKRVGTAYRLGGSDLGVIIDEELAPGLVIDRLIERLRKRLSEPIAYEGVHFAILPHFGSVNFVPRKGEENPKAEDLVSVLEAAQRESQRSYDTHTSRTMDRDALPDRDISFAVDLTKAIANHELDVFFQPKMSLDSREITSCEALVRWRHPTAGFVPPDIFIPLAESLGAINPLTELVLSRCMMELQRLQQILPALKISVNLSQSSLPNMRFLEELAALAGDGERPLDSIIFEITETAMLSDPPRAEAAIESLRHKGAVFSIDDFGTGFTSLSLLSRLSLNELKIDKSFVSTMTTDPRSYALVKAGLDMGSALGLETVAEGVETIEHLDILRGLGCTHVQGFLISKPLAVDKFVDWITGFLSAASIT